MGITVVMMQMLAVGKRQSMCFMVVLRHRLLCVLNCRFTCFSAGSNAFHRDSSERLNRKAQCQQYDDEEFAPVRHGCGV
ncbi:hypothetical protein [Burkholderia sp. Ac-20353]|uniref:hypothetical protein n=1 Tax=Burkholderia sp. Ac-20353 TaxID=2703894 RepID=UPI00197BB71C|nr:hypothetical protein [Burkholderia sp. Ac-20353]